MGYGVLREDSETVGGDHIGDAVVDLRIDVVRTSRKDDAVKIFLNEPVRDIVIRDERAAGIILEKSGKSVDADAVVPASSSDRMTPSF